MYVVFVIHTYIENRPQKTVSCVKISDNKVSYIFKIYLNKTYNMNIKPKKGIQRILAFSRTIPGELFKLTSVVAIVLFLTWSILGATEDSSKLDFATTNFSAIGIVSEITDSTISLADARGSDNSDTSSYTLDIDYLEKVETNTYDPLIISDIRVGDKVIAQGVTDGSSIFIKRIISFTSMVEVELLETATTTEAVATSTDDTASSTEEITTESTTEESTGTTSSSDSSGDSSSTIETITDIIENGIETVADTIGDIIDTVTGNDESSTEESAGEESIQSEPSEESEPESSSEPQSESSSPESGSGESSSESSPIE